MTLDNQLKVGDFAPDFNLPGSNGQALTLSSLRGKNVVLYFYSKDNTTGCTSEALDFKEHYQSIQATDTVIIGISKDKISTHEKFIQKYEIPFLLLSDEETKIAQTYGVWQEKNMYGKKTMGVVRTTFVIDKEGRIAGIFNKVKVKGHVEQVVKFVQELAE
jgi:thioredoxin-dependent peroxiredoxin